MEIQPSDQSVPENAFFIDILGDAVFEREEHIVVSLNHGHAALLSNKHESPPKRIIKPPDIHRIILDLNSTKIIIRGGKLQLIALYI